MSMNFIPRPGGPSGAAVWGDVTGTLENQDDLDTALDAKLESVDWGDVGGTLASQTDLQSALDDKQDESTLATAVGDAIFAYAQPIRLVQTNTALNPASDWVLQVDASAGDIVIDCLDPILLPTYHPWLICRVDTHSEYTVTLTCDNSNSGVFNTILGGTSLELAPGQSVLLSCAQGSGWDVLQSGQMDAPHRLISAGGESLLSGDEFLEFDATAAGFSFTLGSAATAQRNKIHHFKRIKDAQAGNDVTLVGTIDGDANWILAFGDCLSLYSNGTDWKVVSFYQY